LRIWFSGVAVGIDLEEVEGHDDECGHATESVENLIAGLGGKIDVVSCLNVGVGFH